MTFNEFKHWLEGYKESFTNGVPDKKQFEKIMEKLQQVKIATLSTNTPYVPKINDIYPYTPSTSPYKAWY